MLYILPVNAGMLSETGMSYAAVFSATAIAAALATIFMGLYAKYPVALASGMGLNAFFTYTVVFGLGFSWQEALAAVLVSGVLFLIISLTGLRKFVINAIPKNLKLAIGAGIGFFIAFIGLRNAGIIVDNPATLVGLGNLAHPTVLLGLFGIFLIFILYAVSKKTRSFAVILSIAITALVGWTIGKFIPSISGLMPAFDFSNWFAFGELNTTFGQAFKALPSLLARPEAYAVIFAFLFVDFFDTAGTLVAVGKDANLLNEEGELIGSDRAMMVDAVGTVAGSILGTSTVTTFVESTTGIQAGARTGLSAVVTGLLFIVALFLYPLFSIAGGVFDPATDTVYSPVTAMALVFVGAMMMKSLKDIEWDDPIVLISSFVTVISMVLMYSISDGIIFGFTSYTLMMLFTKRRKEVSLTMYILTALFLVHYILQFTILS